MHQAAFVVGGALLAWRPKADGDQPALNIPLVLTVIAGFCGVHDGNLEMLFLAPEARGRGIGRLLVAHAISRQGATRVDVNEQNGQALGFYQRMGFVVTGRSLLDGQGKPYPLLHMVLAGVETV